MPTPTFISTHTNSDKNLLGWNSRFIYIHASDGIEVGEAIEKREVFETIDLNYKKGSVNLIGNYFLCDDGNSFKITMYFTSILNGSTLLFETGLKRKEDNQEFILQTKNGAYHTLPNREDEKLFKYEVILTKYKPSDGNPILLINGCIIYSGAQIDDPSDSDVSFIEQYGKIQFPEDIASKLIINVKGTATINVQSITIEEIK